MARVARRDLLTLSNTLSASTNSQQSAKPASDCCHFHGVSLQHPNTHHVTLMPNTTHRSQTLPVFAGDAFVVTNGANLGDGLSVADDLLLDDVYRLCADAMRGRITIRTDGMHFRVCDQSELGQADAAIIVDSTLTLMSPDGQTTDALVFVELDDASHVAATYLLPLAPLLVSCDYTLVGIDTDSARETLARIACVSFTRGTSITLSNGQQKPIEQLKIGDRVLTRDAGAQEIRWIGQSTVRATGEFAPIRIRAGVLNNVNDLLVSPDHRLFIYQRSDQIGAGRSELLVKARHLVNEDSVTIDQGGFVDYFQLLFDDHHIVYAEGIAAESFLIDSRTAPAIPEELVYQHSPGNGPGLDDLDVSETLLDRKDVATLLRRASAR